MTISMVGVLLNSALYLSAIFLAGLFGHAPWAMRLAVVTMGVTYLSHTATMMAEIQRGHPGYIATANFVVWCSIILGMIAGLLLLFGL